MRKIAIMCTFLHPNSLYHCLCFSYFFSGKMNTLITCVVLLVASSCTHAGGKFGGGGGGGKQVISLTPD